MWEDVAPTDLAFSKLNSPERLWLLLAALQVLAPASFT